MIRLLLAVLAVATGIQPSSAAPDAPWMDILVLDCNSKAHLFPSHPLLHSAVDFSVGTSVYSYVVNTIKQRATCFCPKLTPQQLSQSFTADFGSVLRAWSVGNDNSTIRDLCDIQYSTDQAGLLWESPLPSTCSYDRWSKGQACNLQTPIPTFNMTAQISVSQCPAGSSSPFPYVSITCSGKTCSDLLVPCTSDSDCVASRCTAMAGSSPSSLNKGLSSFFDVTSIIPKTEQNNCPSRWNNDTIGLVELNDMMKALRSLMLPYAPTADGLEVKFCGIDQFAGGSFVDFTSIPWNKPSSIISYFFDALPNSWRSQVQLVFPFDTIVGFLLDDIPSSWPWKIPRALIVDTLRFGWDLVKPIYRALAPSFFESWQNRIIWSGVSEWNGILDNQQNVTNPNRLSGMAFPSIVTPKVEPLSSNPSFVPLLVSTCDMVFSVLPNQPVSITARFPDFQSVFQAAAYRERNAATCRGPTTDAQFRTFFDPLSLEFWQNLVTKTVGPSTGVPGLNYSTPSSLLASVLNDVAMIIPDSCSLDTWLSTSQCSGSYNGLNSLFGGLDLTFYWSINRCKAYPDALPSVNLQCVGQDCGSFFDPNQVQPCVQDSDCPGSFGQCNIVSNSLLGTSSGWFNDFWYGHSSSQCDSGNLDFLELMNYKNMFTKQPAKSFPNAQSIGYCSMVWQKNVITNPSAWVTQAYNIANKTVTINGLDNFVPPNANNPSSTGAAGPTDLPQGTKKVTFVVDVANSTSIMFPEFMLKDVAAALTLAYSSQVSAEQIIPYLQFAGMNVTIKAPASRRLLQMSTYSYYIYGSVNGLSAQGVSSAALASNFKSQVEAGAVDTPNSVADVPAQNVLIEDVNDNAATSSIPQFYALIVAAVAALII